MTRWLVAHGGTYARTCVDQRNNSQLEVMWVTGIRNEWRHLPTTYKLPSPDDHVVLQMRVDLFDHLTTPVNG